MSENVTRRGFLKKSSLIGAAVAAMQAADGVRAAEDASYNLPQIRLGELEVSRLILGTNPFFGFAHQSGDLGEQMREYYTDQRIMAVMDQAAELGITAVAGPPYEQWIRLYNQYLENGGKLRIWISQPDDKPPKMTKAIDDSVKKGAKAIFIQGMRIDEQFREGKLDVIREWLEQVKDSGLPVGMASHRPDVHLAAEEKNFPTDFYFQCFFQADHDDYRDEDRDKAIATIRKIEKPVVGYKILAAGRIPAREGFSFAFKHIRPKDGVCVGMFPKVKPDMIEEDVGLTRKLSKGASA
jgi:hypothetical protein